jgi:hypothetical protein
MISFLARLALIRGRGEKKRAIDRSAQAQRGLNITAQIGNNHLLVNHSTAFASRSPIGGQRNIDDAVRTTEYRRALEEDKRGMPNVGYLGLNWRGSRFGISGHDGPSLQFWEWSDEEMDFVAALKPIRN